MKNVFPQKMLLPAVLVLAGLLTLQAVGLYQSSGTDEQHFAESVNLALRQTADRLLDHAGDTTSTIPPVEQTATNEFLLRLERNFSYDSLPGFLEKAFEMHDISEDYHVSVTDCLHNELVLGYTARVQKAGEEVPCNGRDQKAGCYHLQVSFPGKAAGNNNLPWIWLALAAGVWGALAFFFANFLKKRKLSTNQATEQTDLVAHPEAPAPVHAAALSFGKSALDLGNQTVFVGGERQALTYREAKLLHLFCHHQNQLLERDFILKAVWEDEGILVGRSLDVFVSRLRKILSADDSLKIASVHGVGYRMEITHL